MSKTHPHICTDMTTLLEESHCKYYKRVLVGILRHLGGKISVPGELFDDVGPSEGFDVVEDEEWIVTLSDEWEYGEDDCGHEMQENVTFSASSFEPKIVALKVIDD